MLEIKIGDSITRTTDSGVVITRKVIDLVDIQADAIVVLSGNVEKGAERADEAYKRNFTLSELECSGYEVQEQDDAETELAKALKVIAKYMK